MNSLCWSKSQPRQKDKKRGMWSKQLAEKTAILFGVDDCSSSRHALLRATSSPLSLYSKSAHHSSFKRGELREVHNNYYSTLSGTRCSENLTESQAQQPFLPEIPVFSNQELLFYRFLFQRKRKKARMAKRFNSQVYLSNVTD